MNAKEKGPRGLVVNGFILFAALVVFVMLAVSIRDLVGVLGTGTPGDGEPQISGRPEDLPHESPLRIIMAYSMGYFKSYGYEGDGNMSITYEAPNDHVIYLPLDGVQRKVAVSERDLKDFVKTLNKAGFSTWKRRYPPMVKDDGSWSLYVKFEGATYVSRGESSSVVPDSKNLNRALQRLVKDDSITICDEWSPHIYQGK